MAQLQTPKILVDIVFISYISFALSSTIR